MFPKRSAELFVKDVDGDSKDKPAAAAAVRAEVDKEIRDDSPSEEPGKSTHPVQLIYFVYFHPMRLVRLIHMISQIRHGQDANFKKHMVLIDGHWSLLFSLSHFSFSLSRSPSLPSKECSRASDPDLGDSSSDTAQLKETLNLQQQVHAF